MTIFVFAEESPSLCSLEFWMNLFQSMPPLGQNRESGMAEQAHRPQAQYSYDQSIENAVGNNFMQAVNSNPAQMQGKDAPPPPEGLWGNYWPMQPPPKPKMPPRPSPMPKWPPMPNFPTEPYPMPKRPKSLPPKIETKIPDAGSKN